MDDILAKAYLEVDSYSFKKAVYSTCQFGCHLRRLWALRALHIRFSISHAVGIENVQAFVAIGNSTKSFEALISEFSLCEIF